MKPLSGLSGAAAVFLMLFVTVSGYAGVTAADSLSATRNVPPDTLIAGPVNQDSLFAAARSAAFEAKDYPTAIRLCQTILAENERHYDARIFLGRLYAWEGRYAEAIDELSQVVDEQKYFEDARSALVDVCIWDKRYEQALEIIHAGLILNPLNLDLYYQQAVCQEALGESEKARDALQKLLKINPGHTKANRLLADLSEHKKFRKVTLAYGYDRLADTQSSWQVLVGTPTLDPWHLLTLELEQRMAFGPLIGRYTLANRFSETGMQLELESYPHIRQGTYAYVGLGYSWTSLFPVSRLGLEVFQSFHRSYEVSLGTRVLFLEEETIALVTTSLGKYLGNYWFDLRNFITPDNSNPTLAWVITGRRYFEDAETYLELLFSQGESPDIAPGTAELDYLGAYRLAMNYQFKVGKITVARVEFSLGNMEVRPDAYRGDTGFKISLARRL